eukprot:scaffold900_cov399-Pavlova_lutheri.AAC.13
MQVHSMPPRFCATPNVDHRAGYARFPWVLCKLPLALPSLLFYSLVSIPWCTTCKELKMRSKSLLQGCPLKLSCMSSGFFYTLMTCQKNFLLCPSYNNMYMKHQNTLSNIPVVHSHA